jgi:antitoxin Phd
MNTWPLYKAKNRLSLVIDRAISEGAQIITRRGEPTAVVLSFAEYQKSAAQNRINKLLDSVRGANLEIPRDVSVGRTTTLE